MRNVPSSKKVFYQNFMSRLVLNTESHMEERVYELNDFSPMFDEDEIRKTAKYLLMLFYYVDGFHLNLIWVINILLLNNGLSMRISHKILEGHANKAASTNRVSDIPPTNISNDDSIASDNKD